MKRLFIIFGVFLLTTGGCRGYYAVEYDVPPPHGQVIIESPPAPMVEDVGPAPYEGAAWVAGYWSWSGARYVWVPGRYLRPPTVGYIWYPGGYVRRGRGYVYVRGRWARPGYRSRHRYVHPRPRYRQRHYRQRRYKHRNRSDFAPGQTTYSVRSGAPARGHRAPPAQAKKRKHRAPAAHAAPPAKAKRHRAPPPPKRKKNQPEAPGR